MTRRNMPCITTIATTAIATSAAHLVMNSSAATNGDRAIASANATAKLLGGCETTCAPGAVIEEEPCGTDLNPGCGGAGPKPILIQTGDEVCGTFWAASGTRDVDMYRFTHAGGPVTWTVKSNVPTSCFIMSAGCPASVIATGTGDCPDGVSATATLAAGEYQLLTAPAAFDGYPCSGDSAYVASLTGGATPCPDLNSDGVINVIDLLTLINAWGECE